MFSKVLEQDDTLSKNINNLIQRSIRGLKKDNIVVWFLKSVRTSLLKELQRSESFPTQQINLAIQTLRSLEHYHSLPIDKIQRYDYRGGVTEALLKFRDWENEWATGREQWIDITEEMNSGYIDIIKEYPNGFAWLTLNVPYCEKEGNAMGHCGNRPSAVNTDNILSFRKIEKRDGKILSRPSLTFILRKLYNYDIYILGEMKGRANEKPNPKYHPYIMDLLMYKKPDSNWLVDYVIGGGYEAENNFHIDDLDENSKNKLLSIRPELTIQSYKEIMQNKGVDVREAIVTRLREEDLNGETHDASIAPDGSIHFQVNEDAAEFESWHQSYEVLKLNDEDYIKFINGVTIIPLFPQSEIPLYLKSPLLGKNSEIYGIIQNSEIDNYWEWVLPQEGHMGGNNLLDDFDIIVSYDPMGWGSTTQR
jgi:hypothetical protein